MLDNPRCQGFNRSRFECNAVYDISAHIRDITVDNQDLVQKIIKKKKKLRQCLWLNTLFLGIYGVYNDCKQLKTLKQN